MTFLIYGVDLMNCQLRYGWAPVLSAPNPTTWDNLLHFTIELEFHFSR